MHLDFFLNQTTKLGQFSRKAVCSFLIQDKTIKDMKKPAVKPDLNSTGGGGDGGKKQARFVLPSSKKFEKTLGSTGGSSRSK